MAALKGFDRLIRVLILVGAGTALMAPLATEAAAAKFKVLHSFCTGGRCNDGSNPQGPLLMDSAGDFFGTTANGGHNGFGTVFELKRSSTGKREFSKLYGFCPGEGSCDSAHPVGALIIDTQGNLYGTTANGGNNNSGVVFELSPPASGSTKWSAKTLYYFCLQQNCPDGSNPQAGLTYAGAASGVPYDGASPLFGTTGGGGAQGRGVAFQLTRNSGQWTETVLYAFCSLGKPACADGSSPSGGVFIDQTGNFFGVTFNGGSNKYGDPDGNGVVFQLAPNGSGWSETVLWRFCLDKYCDDGATPYGELIEDNGGVLYGTTRNGGGSCPPLPRGVCGVAFEIVPNGANSQETVIHKFCRKADCTDGANPIAGLALSPSGDLVGTSSRGGGNDIDEAGLGGGTIFRLNSTSYKVLYRFCSSASCADGEYPNTRSLLDVSGSIYGTTELGGAFGAGDLDGGVVYRLKP